MYSRKRSGCKEVTFLVKGKIKYHCPTWSADRPIKQADIKGTICTIFGFKSKIHCNSVIYFVDLCTYIIPNVSKNV